MDLEIKRRQRPVYVVQESKLREQYNDMLKDMIIDTAPTPKELANYIIDHHKTIDGMDAWEFLGFVGVFEVEPFELDMQDAVRENTFLFPDIVSLSRERKVGSVTDDDAEFDLEIRAENGSLVSLVRSEEMDF